VDGRDALRLTARVIIISTDAHATRDPSRAQPHLAQRAIAVSLTYNAA